MGVSARVLVLGPVEVLGPNGSASLVGARQRALAASLALDAGRPVGQSRLIDALWGDDPPRTAIKTLHSHVARVRQALADCGLPNTLVTRDTGYALMLPRESVDAHCFEQRVAAAARELAAEDFAAAAANLRTGLELWRGDALADAEPAGWASAESGRLHEVRLSATEDLWDAELAGGRHGQAIGELERLLVSHPGRERLVGLYMVALYRHGRHTDALGAYQRLKAYLADELGVDPGPELQRRYTAVLQRDRSLDLSTPVLGSPTRPAQLPAKAGHFTGRAEALSILEQLLADPDDESRIAVISGSAGIGKTALAVHWAHRVSEQFDAGLLFVDLGGHDPATALTPEQALASLLRGLGVLGDRVPGELSELVGLYRSLTHNQPILVVVDNAYQADQVLPLVPATSTGLLLVTSRQRLTAMAAHHATSFIRLEAMRDDETKQLLRRVIGTARVDQEPQAVATVTELCGGLPLALRIAAAKVAAEPNRSIAQFAHELSGGLDELSVPGDSRSVRTVFASAYRALSPPAAALFRRLGLHPGQTFDKHLAAAVGAVELPAARADLAELATAHLVMDAGGCRYRFHDLIRLYAKECAHRDEKQSQVDSSVGHLLDWYLATADAANRVIGQARDRIVPELRYPPPELPFEPESGAVLSYLDSEHINMTPVVRFAAEHGHDVTAWQLTYLLTGFFEFRGHWSDRLELALSGLAAASRLNDPFAEGLMQSTIGVACVELHRFSHALGYLSDALRCMEAAGDKRGQGVALNNMAVAYVGLGRLDDAVESFESALAIHQSNQHSLGIALALNNIGYVYAKFGRYELAFARLEQALTVARDSSSTRAEAIALNSLGQTHLYAGDYPAALDLLSQSLALRHEISDRRGSAETLNLIGTAHVHCGDFTIAIERFGEAEEISRSVGDQHFEATTLSNIGAARLRLGELDGAGDYLRRALALRARIPDPDEEAVVHRHLAELSELRGDARAAAFHEREVRMRTAGGPHPQP